jgi:hypothetical protein
MTPLVDGLSHRTGRRPMSESDAGEAWGHRLG